MSPARILVGIAVRCMTAGVRSVTLLMLGGGLVAGCRCPHSPAAAQTPPPPGWREWQNHRHESIAGTNGWTTLVSRYWLPEGKTFAGADPTNQLALPAGHAAPAVGVFLRQGKSVRFQAAPGVAATVDGAAVSEADLTTDKSATPTRLSIGPLSFVIIERGDRLGVRARDPLAPARIHFAGLRYFPYDPSWRITGRFEAFPAPRTLRVPDASGGTQEFTSPGAVVFSHAGKEYRLDVVEEQGEEDYFVIFTDRSAGHSTYEAGRFLYVARPDRAGHVTIDFNCAYTPPCGFTPFATCPRPPAAELAALRDQRRRAKAAGGALTVTGQWGAACAGGGELHLALGGRPEADSRSANGGEPVTGASAAVVM